MPLTRRMSIEAVAVDGMTLEAGAPIRELAMPRMFSDGCVISSTSIFGRAVRRAELESCISCASMSGASAIARFSVSLSGATSS